MNTTCTAIYQRQPQPASFKFVNYCSFAESSVNRPCSDSSLHSNYWDWTNAMWCWPDFHLRPATPCGGFCAAVHLIAGLGPRDHVTEHMMELHWLPIRQCISFKLCLMMHAALTGRPVSKLHSWHHQIIVNTTRTKQASCCCDQQVWHFQNKNCFWGTSILHGWSTWVELTSTTILSITVVIIHSLWRWKSWRHDTNVDNSKEYAAGQLLKKKISKPKIENISTHYSQIQNYKNLGKL